MEEVLGYIKQAVAGFDRKGVEELTKKAIGEKIDPVVIFDALKDAITKIGEDFSKGDIFLPQLVGAADAMEGGMPLIIEEIKKQGKALKSLGTVAIGTVFGDIHSIGKTMVATLLAAEGFFIKDLGINVSAEKFVESVEEGDVDVVAMSALLTTTAPQQQKVIEMLEKRNLREKVKVIVGGGAITQEFAEEIGADGYSGTAPAAGALIKRLLK
jgi:methylmalonyl-CoA mutase cobalamin-binding domain/chain